MPAASSSPADTTNSDMLATVINHIARVHGLRPPRPLPADFATPKDPRTLKHGPSSNWEAQYMMALTEKYGRNGRWKLENPTRDSLNDYFVGDLRACNHEIMRLGKKLLSLEGRLVAYAIENLVDMDFEAKWNALSDEKKGQFVLQGLIRAAFRAPREQSRYDCPEARLNWLVGGGVIELLKVAVACDDTGDCCLKTLFLFSSPHTDGEYPDDPASSDETKARRYLRILLRNFYIVETMIGILEEFNGLPAHFPTLQGEEQKVDEGNRECSECFDSAEVLCRCSGCGIALYCSSACQSRDWLQHKRLCRMREPRFLPAILVPLHQLPPVFVGCPDPAPGVARSPALWRQIRYLADQESYNVDYHLEYRPGETIGITIPKFDARLTFCVLRRRAMISSDAVAVERLRCMLVHTTRNIADFPGTEEHIRDQLVREYRVPLPVGEHVCHRGSETPTLQQEMVGELQFAERRADLEKRRLEKGSRKGGRRFVVLVDNREEMRLVSGMGMEQVMPWVENEMPVGSAEVMPWLINWWAQRHEKLRRSSRLSLCVKFSCCLATNAVVRFSPADS
ncbi:MYND-type domain-containing protein [Favolaschia claudopus]|uniref:MYND-type domain-containing protein n=1 Tax=Favolaschia claudopus TaxID=2862362 RepID=A0AAW0EJW7_9AGAR